jgi:anti-sigma regulatory factor (Ser/Thr protein kinase)
LVSQSTNRSRSDGIVVSILVSSKRTLIRPLDSFVRSLLSELTPFVENEQLLDSMELIFNEALVNILDHAYQLDESKQLSIEIRVECDKLEFRFEDWGRTFDPGSIPAPNLDRPGERGLGLWLMQQLADEVHYECGLEGTNVLRLVKRIPDMKPCQD